MTDYSLGPYVPSHYALLACVLMMRPQGIALEFGVGKGESTQLIAHHMPVVGFDSFKGLPQDWREGFGEGMFACDPPDIPNTTLVTGLFEDTLPAFDWHSLPTVGLIHIDCDLYSSTKTVLDNALPGIRAIPPHGLHNTYIVFDEWHGYEGCEDHEQRAWREFADETGVQWQVVGHGFQQWAVLIA